MNIVFLLFDRFTFLDVIGPYEVLSRIPGADTVFAAQEAKVYRDGWGKGLEVKHTLNQIPGCEVLVVPGGPGVDDILQNDEVMSWLRQIDSVSQWTTSVCSGSILLAKAGLLQGRRCTTHWKRKDQLRQYDVRVSDERYVNDGKYITSAGVSAGIDMALFLASKLIGDEGANTIQRGIEYDHEWK